MPYRGYSVVGKKLGQSVNFHIETLKLTEILILKYSRIQYSTVQYSKIQSPRLTYKKLLFGIWPIVLEQWFIVLSIVFPKIECLSFL